MVILVVWWPSSSCSRCTGSSPAPSRTSWRSPPGRPSGSPSNPTVDNYARLFDNPALLLAVQHRLHLGGGYDPDLYHRLPGGLRPGQEALHRPGGPVHHHHLRHGPAQAGHRHPSDPGDDQLLPSERHPLGRHPAHGGLALRRIPDEAVLRDHPHRDPGGGPGGRRG